MMFYAWHLKCFLLLRPPMKQIKTGPMKSKAKHKFVVLITANEKISNFRNSGKSGKTMKTIVQALCREVPVAIRTSAN
jgi:hypothetical protein